MSYLQPLANQNSRMWLYYMLQNTGENMGSDLSLEEQATNYHTMRHIERVRNLLNKVIIELMERGERHDQSKLATPEVEAFTTHNHKLAALTFGSPEYDACKKEMQPALDHHYANNRHHPEHHKNGIDDMDLLDCLEMIVDWKASSERQNNGNIRKSIERNGGHFKMSTQLIRIFENTVDVLFD